MTTYVFSTLHLSKKFVCKKFSPQNCVATNIKKSLLTGDKNLAIGYANWQQFVRKCRVVSMCNGKTQFCLNSSLV